MNLMTLISSFDCSKEKKEVGQSTANFNTSIIDIIANLQIIYKLVIMSFSLAAITVRMLARGLAIYYLQQRAGHFAGVSFSKS